MSQSAFRHIWEYILRPEALFTLATCQALSPYVFWQFGVGRAVSSSELTYIPALLWVIGWLSFLTGCFLVRRRIGSRVEYTLRPGRMRILTAIWCLVGVSAVEILLAIRLYGTLPILSYIRGDNQIDVMTATALQTQSFVGQIALLSITVAVLAGLLLEIAITSIERKKKVPLVFYLGLAAALSLGIINGKRIDTFRLFVYMISGLLLYSRDAVRNITVVIPFIKRPAISLLLIALTLAGLLSLFGPIAGLRNQGRIERSSFDELVIYQEGPILNMEAQARSAGVGPRRFSFIFPLQSMIPIKWVGALGITDEYPPREDPTSPAGFYEFLQWSWGIPGVILVSGLVGMFCKWLYVNCRTHVKYLLCYSYTVFSILLAHSFNEFLIAPLVLVPCALLWISGVLTNSRLLGGANQHSQQQAERAVAYRGRKFKLTI